MELGVLGPLQVRQDGTPVTIPGAKPRAILTMLGLHSGSVVSAGTLIELLWGDDPPRTANKALQTHISSLRRTLGDGFVLTEGAGWTLAAAEVDASRYKRAARMGRDAGAAGDISGAVARFEEALALWRGIPELPDGQRGLSEKTRWIEGHAALLEDRADALLATGRAAEIVGELEAAVAEAPLRERRWGQLMLALYRAGRQGEALGAYQRARSLLAEELGVDPGPELRRLEAAVVAQDASLDIPVAQNVSAVTRAVTFLLTDIEGSTAAWEADADAMAVALARHDELVEQVVTSRGGRLIKTRGEGDATFSVFERPSAAAAAAIELQDAIGHEPWALQEPMRIRIALHTGEVELRDGDYFGRAVNRAARLRSLAAGGQILCSGATAELVIDSLPDDVMLKDLGMRQLRNLARPEHVFELRLESAEELARTHETDAPMVRPGLPAVLSGPGPFVGRASELERLLSTWRTALDGGMRAVLIAGEPGVGKTRLAGEWSRQAYELGAVVLYGRCDEDLGAPYQPFAEALRSLMPCLGAERLRGLRGVEALLPLVPGLTDVLPDLAAPPRADPETERYALFDAVVALLEVASTSAPVVLILDDLHWAAKPTLLLLRHLLRFGDHARVQIVGTYRSTDLDRSHPLAAMLADLHRDGTANRISLSGLDEDDVTTYVAEAGYDDEELARALASVTGGNPFFLIEALRHVDESGGVWDPSTLPQGVREAVSRRLSRLPAETNKALAAAAVVGSRFAVDLVERVLDQDLVDAFDEACKAGIVIEEHGGRYRFNHAIVRQSLLAELASVRRMRLHQRIAATLETEAGADDELLAELAHHYFECAWAGNAVKAVEYCHRAADQAMARLAYEGAADLYDRAVHALEEIDDELPDRDEQAAELLVARCEALLAAGDVTSAAGAVAQLQEATVDSARLAAWATCFDGQLSMLIHPERLDEVEAAVGAAAAKLAELDDAAGEAQAHTVRAACLARLGRIGDCEIALDDALTAARRAREYSRVNAVLAGAPLAALWGPNPVPRAGGRCLDVVRLLRITTDSPAVEATSTRCQAVLEAFRGRAAAARRMIDSARRTVTELGLRHALLEVEQFAGIVELVVDDPAAAEPHLRKAYNGFRRMRIDVCTAETAALLGRACLALDRDAEADELCSESESLAGHALKASIAWRTLRALLLARRGEHDEARRVAEAAVAMAERTDALVDHGDACLTLATVLGAAGDSTGARAAAERAVDLYERKGAAALAESARRVLGAADRPQPPQPEPAPVELTNACVQVGDRLIDAVHREAWDEVIQLFVPYVSFESRRKIVGFARIDLPSSQWPQKMRGFLDNGMVRYQHAAVAVRGERLALTRLEIGTADVSSGAPQDEMLQVVGLDEEGRIALVVWFDVEDMGAAMAELDATHVRFEKEQRTVPAQTEPPSAKFDTAAARVSERVMAALDREDWDEFERLSAPEASIESRRKIVGFKQTDFQSEEVVRQTRRDLESGAMRLSHVVIAVRGERLALARVVLSTPDVGPGAPQDEFLQVYRIDEEGRFALQVWFDLEDMDAAIAELDAMYKRAGEPQPKERRLKNAASKLNERYLTYFMARDWDALTEILADNMSIDDRRHVVNSGVRQGRNVVLNDLRLSAEFDLQITPTVIATRGERLALVHGRFCGKKQQSEADESELLDVVEIDADNRITAHIEFDLEDFEAAIAELDAHYRAGEAAAHAHTWSLVSGVYAAFNRREFLATTPDVVSIDHRRGAAFAPGDIIAYIEAAWNDSPDTKIYIEAIHRLSNTGAVVTHVAQGISEGGFDAEWRDVFLLTAEGDLISRCELFNEADLDAALARLDELSRPAPRLKNAASQAFERYFAHFVARNWDALAEVMADDICTDDRRRVLNAGIRHGRDAEIANLRAAADVGITSMTSVVIATRGERLVLGRAHTSGGDNGSDEFTNQVLGIAEVNSHNQIAAIVVFDFDDVEAAFAELDVRYLAGEAAAHAHTWSVVTGAYAALNRREIPEVTPDFASIDHRRGTKFAPGDLIAYVVATWDLVQDGGIYIEAVHRLNNLGAVVTHVTRGSSQEGFDAEWREVFLITVEGDLLSRCELFDESDLNAALARFDELSRPGPRLENAASQAAERYVTHFVARGWNALAKILADDIVTDDRRHVVSAGMRRGREAELAASRAATDAGLAGEVTSVVIATRGERLALVRVSTREPGPEKFRTGVLGIAEVNSRNQIAAIVTFDADDIDAAFAELDARYIAGEAAAYAHTFAAIVRTYAAFNSHELPAMTPDLVSIDHRRARGFAPGDLIPYIHATWDLTPQARIEAVHRLNDIGAVIMQTVHGSSQDGFDAEWREVAFVTVEGDMLSRCELFDEADLDTALARFDELSRPAPRLENAASRVDDRYGACLRACDWDAMAEILADDTFLDDRRRVVGIGVRQGRDLQIADMRAAADRDIPPATQSVIATRGERLALHRVRLPGGNQRPESFHSELLNIVEIDTDEKIVARFMFEFDDIDAAFAELDARYLAGEAAAHARTWSVIASSFAAFNRHEVLAADWVTIDHRRGSPFEPSNIAPGIRTIWDLTPDLSIHIEAVHRLTDSGVVITHNGKGSSQEGFDAEWRAIDLLMVEGDRISRCEVFDEADLDAALARFDELSRTAPRLENAASQVAERFQAQFAARNWKAMAEMLADDYFGDDRRPVVGAGAQHGRNVAVADMQAIADVRGSNITSTAIATRGARLVLMRMGFFGPDQESAAFVTEVLGVAEINARDQLVAGVTFDLDNLDAAFEELDARYLAGEAAAHAHTWSLVKDGYAALNRRELPPATPDCVNIDHRKLVAIEASDFVPSLRAAWDLTSQVRFFIERVHRLSNLGAVVTQAVSATSQEDFAGEWREIALLAFDGDLIKRSELFDEADLDAALARFDELSRPAPRLENAASQVAARFFAYFGARDWDAIAAILAENVSHDDRRHVVNAGVLRGRDAQMANLRAIAQVGVATFSSTVIATRGTRLALVRTRSSGQDQRPEAILTEELGVVEINSDNRMAAYVAFDTDNIDAAFEELEARYLEGEAAAHSRTWSAIARAYARFNKHEVPATTPGSVAIEHRPLLTTDAADLAGAIRAVWDLTPDASIYIEAVHRLCEFGAVVTHSLKGTSPEGVDAEWRMVDIFMVKGDLISDCEVFDEAHIDTALARFDELHLRARKLENAASRVAERFQAQFAARNWEAMAEMLADDFSSDDRRRVVGAGVRHGRDADIENLRAWADVGVENITSDVIAIRGGRLVLARAQWSGADQRPEAFHTEALGIVEINADNQIVARVMFDHDDIDAAFQELDARYLAGEAAAYARTWSLIAGTSAAFNRREMLPTTPDWVNIDHRRAAAFAPGEMSAYTRAIWDDAPDSRVYIEAVHRLNSLGAVVTEAAHGTSQQGFDAEWRLVGLATVDHGLINRAEMFDEADLDAALARFDELSRPATRLENAASRTYARMWKHFMRRDWTAVAETIAHDIVDESGRRLVGHGIRRGRDAEMENLRVTAELGLTNVTPTVIATRGERLALHRVRLSGPDQQPGAFFNPVLRVVGTDADERIVVAVLFDIDDLDAAFEELDARYLAGEAAAHAHTWSVITRAYAAANRNELPASTPDRVNIDHRRGSAFGPGELEEYLRATWDVVPDTKIYVESVHRLSNLGAVITHAMQGTSRDGFDAEWRTIHVLTVEGDLINRSEMFDETDVEAALAHFEELHPQARRLENAASRLYESFFAYFAARDWAAIEKILADDSYLDDRRRAVNAGLWDGRDVFIENLHATANFGLENLGLIATRGRRLFLGRFRWSPSDQAPEMFHTEALCLVEIDTGELIQAFVTFDLDDIDAAFAELDARYLAGEAAAHAHTWSVISGICASVNRHRLPATTPDLNYVDHRPLVTIESTDLPASIRAVWELTPEIGIYWEAVHRLSDLGAVVTHTARGVSPEDFDAEWRLIDLFMVEGELVSRCEMFDESDLDAALARFDELQRQTRRLENAASRAHDRYFAYFGARDWTALAEILSDNSFVDDRCRMVSVGFWDGREAVIAMLRALEAGADITLAVIATRGERLALTRICSVNRDPGHGDFTSEKLIVAEIDGDEQIAAQIAFDPNDLDAAFAELDARYLAGEAAAYSQTWSVLTRECAAFNRHELPTADWATIDHRRLAVIDATDPPTAMRAIWDVTPNLSIYIEAVHRLSSLGALATYTACGSSPEGFDAEWRMILLLTLDGDRIDRCEIFDETDLDAALGRFDELQRQTRRLENAASQAEDRFFAYFGTRNWPAIAEILADASFIDDRRRVVNAGFWDGRDVVIENMRALDEGRSITSTVIATRGERLALSRICSASRDLRHGEFDVEMLGIAEIDIEGRITAHVLFDPNEIDAAFEELDARYLADEAAAHSHTWSVIAQSCDAFNRHELPPADLVFIDHRPLVTIGETDLPETLRVILDLTPDASIKIEAVHRLSGFGAVATYTVFGSSLEGLDAEWRVIQLLTVEGDLLTRCEVFDETDLDTALGRFDELHTQTRRLRNRASQVAERFLAHFAARDWDAITEVLADGYYNDDRRRAVGAGLRRGRESNIAEMRTTADLGVEVLTSEDIAIRGERLLLSRVRWSASDEVAGGFHTEALSSVELDADERIAAIVTFDPDDIDAAFEELGARYLAGEAAAHARTWSVIASGYAALNRHEVPPTTPDWVTIDHRRGIAFAPAEMAEYIRATVDVASDIKGHIEVVHRLSNLGAVVTHTMRGTSQEGFDARWREIVLLTVDGDLVNRCEMFDEADLDAALARFDELDRPAPLLENAATRARERQADAINLRDVDSLLALTAADARYEDRRKGLRDERAVRPEVVRAIFELAPRGWRLEITPFAIRGSRIALTRDKYRDTEDVDRPITAEHLMLTEVMADGRVCNAVLFDPDDIDAAFAELTARWIASGEVAHPEVIEAAQRVNEISNSHDWDAIAASLGGAAYVSHRQLAHARAETIDDYMSSIRTLASLVPDYRSEFAEILAHSASGVLVDVVVKGTSTEGAAVEIPLIQLGLLDGDRVTRVEFFDPDQRDLALARFEELNVRP
ncbi:AAA family ATPase [Mycobacterium fragae]|uniref:Cyclase n=1 Tax=Mycobacterium fragae TaxID=1260918 RepID=A0A1X1UJB0_9MYCO|nr:BTAD domain-containing putative transcriptional regulator [Mycobacterium fragae]MCV7401162.1 AAA family ATPase [Mycobacterium fragae]ORV56897.1 hypothetical protein AWC06_01465 [Mycobacterium fragae]